jgi:hypothetical protein
MQVTILGKLFKLVPHDAEDVCEGCALTGDDERCISQNICTENEEICFEEVK